MIHISLQRDHVRIPDRRKVYTSLATVVPLALELSKTMRRLGADRDVQCCVTVTVANTVRLEIRNT